MRVPRALQKGDTVALLSPSSPLSSEQPVEQVAAAVERLGLCPKLYPSCWGSAPSGYSAASPEQRAKDLQSAFLDEEVQGIWCTRGGSTAARLLPFLDFQRIAGHPKPLIGFSDITTLHMALQQRCGFVTYHGPNANRALGWKDAQDFSWQSLRAAWNVCGTTELQNPPDEPILTIRSGWGEGRLIGGNLSLVTASLGTRWQIDAKGKVLFLEDVGEDVYVLERMLTQLRYAGILAQTTALVFGCFAGCSNSYRPSYGAQQLIEDLFADWCCPVLYNVRSAHCHPMVTLPMGMRCLVDGCGGRLLIFPE